MAEWAHCYYVEIEELDLADAGKYLCRETRPTLIALGDALATLRDWTEETTQNAVVAVAEELSLKLGKVAQPLRVALTGRAASPGIGTTLVLVGRERTLERIDRALAHIDTREPKAQSETGLG